MNNTLERKIAISSVLKFAVPSVVMMVVMSLYTVVDGMFVSRLVGTDAFSAVNIVYPLISFTIGLGTMFGAGTTAMVSKKLGEGKQHEARQNLTFIVLCTIVFGAAISGVSFVLLKPILYTLGSNEAIFGYCRDYAQPLVFFLIANILQFQFQNLYVANGKPHIGLAVTTIGGVANVVLDYLFLAKLGMGVAGAAVATGIGYSIPALFGLCYFACGRKENLCFVKPKVNWPVLLRCAANGSSEMVSNLSTSITTFLFNIILMGLIGPDGVAAIAILLYLDFVLVAISLGYSIGVAPLISYNHGCENPEKLRKLFKVSAGFCTAVGAIMAIGTIAFAEPLAGIFARAGTLVYDLAVTGLRVYAIGYLFKGYNVFASAMFTAFGNGAVSAVLSFMRTLVFLVICLLGMSAAFGVDGVWYASPLAETLSVILSVLFTFKYRKQYCYLGGKCAAG